MALPPAAPDRQPRHQRRMEVQVFARPDGLWEVDALLADTKSRDLQLPSGLRPAGTPVHEMWLRLVIDTHMDILEAGSESRWMPYAGICDVHGQAGGAEPGDAYSRLVGLNLRQGFRQALRERLGGAQGCTHLTELAQVLPTAVIQAFAGEVIDVTEGTPATGPGPDQPPFQIDRCHALKRSGEVVRLHYPRWFRPEPPHNPGATA
jgi:hypothetical protein